MTVLSLKQCLGKTNDQNSPKFFFQKCGIMKIVHAMPKSHVGAEEKHDIDFHWTKIRHICESLYIA